MKNLTKLLTIFILCFSSSYISSLQEPIFLGILETHNTNWPCKKSSDVNEFYSFIRLAFILENKKWIPINVSKKEMLIYDIESYKFKPFDKSYYKKIFTTYYMLYDIQNIGAINSIESNEFPDENIWRSVISIKEKKLPRIGKISDSFTDDYCGETSYRPIIVSTVQNFKDPLNWKLNRNSIDKKILNDVVKNYSAILQKEYGGKATFEDDHEEIPEGNAIYKRSYISKNNDLLINIVFKAKRGTIFPKWFYVSNNEIKYLGSYKNLVDAADYDNDGFTDFIFFETTYNSCGYILYYDNMQKKADFGYGFN